MHTVFETRSACIVDQVTLHMSQGLTIRSTSGFEYLKHAGRGCTRNLATLPPKTDDDLDARFPALQ